MTEPDDSALPENENITEFKVIVEASAVVARGTATDDRIYPGEEA